MPFWTILGAGVDDDKAINFAKAAKEVVIEGCLRKELIMRKMRVDQAVSRLGLSDVDIEDLGKVAIRGMRMFHQRLRRVARYRLADLEQEMESLGRSRGLQRNSL